MPLANIWAEIQLKPDSDQGGWVARNLPWPVLKADKTNVTWQPPSQSSEFSGTGYLYDLGHSIDSTYMDLHGNSVQLHDGMFYTLAVDEALAPRGALAGR